MTRCYLCGANPENIMRHLTGGHCPGKGWKERWGVTPPEGDPAPVEAEEDAGQCLPEEE